LQIIAVLDLIIFIKLSWAFIPFQVEKKIGTESGTALSTKLKCSASKK